MMYSLEFEYSVGYKSRGENKISLIVNALRRYTKIVTGKNDDNSIDALREVTKACAWWLFDKQQKIADNKSNRTVRRAKIITDLLNASLDELEKSPRPRVSMPGENVPQSVPARFRQRLVPATG